MTWASLIGQWNDDGSLSSQIRYFYQIAEPLGEPLLPPKVQNNSGPEKKKSTKRARKSNLGVVGIGQIGFGHDTWDIPDSMP